jgi:hypothetical protein
LTGALHLKFGGAPGNLKKMSNNRLIDYFQLDLLVRVKPKQQKI